MSAADPYREPPAAAIQVAGEAPGRWPARWACAVLGHRWKVLRVNYHKASIVPSVILCGRDLDCLRCGERWRDGGPIDVDRLLPWTLRRRDAR